MKRRFLKKQIKNIHKIWDTAMDMHQKYKDDYYDQEIAPGTTNPAWGLAESLVEELTGLNLKQSHKKAWIDGKYIPEVMIEMILYKTGSVKDLRTLAKKVKANR